MTTAPPLSDLPLLLRLPPDARKAVMQAAIRRTYAAGATIVAEGAPCRAVYLVAAGYVRVSRFSFSGREQVLAQLGPGSVFNAVSALRPAGVNLATARAVTSVTVYGFLRADFLRLLDEHPSFARALLHDLADRLAHVTGLVEDLALRTVRGRMARFLLEHAEADQVTRRWTQAEIAAHLGTVRDMVGRTLRAFAEEGLVRLERQRIVLLDRSRLEEAARR